MRSIIMPLVGFATLAVASTGAGAADLPRRAAPPVFVPAPAFTWTGFYAGLNAGYAFDSNDNDGFPILPGFIAGGPPGSIINSPGTDGILSFNQRGNRGGFTGGGQVGYNYQFPNGSPNGVVVGVEADAQYLGLGRTGGTFGPADYTFAPTGGLLPNLGQAFFPQSGLIPGLDNPTIIRSAARMDYFGTVRGRFGYAFDRALFYVTGGFAYGDGGSGVTGSGNSFSTGYTAGGGIEYAFTSNLTARAEFLYVNLDKGRGTATGTFDGGTNTITLATIGGQNSFTAVRGGINYRFNAF